MKVRSIRNAVLPIVPAMGQKKNSSERLRREARELQETAIQLEKSPSFLLNLSN